MQPIWEVTSVKFKEPIQMLSQVVTNQIGQKSGAKQEVANILRIWEFLRMNTQSFTRSRTTYDIEKFIKKMQNVFEVMHRADVEWVELAAYQLNNNDRTSFD